MYLSQNRRERVTTLATVACAALVFSACNLGGSGGGTAADAVGATGLATTRTLGWAPSSGPVVGYRVWIARDSGPFEMESDVSMPQATVSGTPGATARIIVAAFDAMGRVGAASPPSDPFTFPQSAPAGPSAQAQSGAVGDRSIAAVGSTALPSVSADTPTEDADPSPVAVAPADKTAWDTSGDLVAEILWEAGDALRLTTSAGDPELVFMRPAPDTAAVAMGDFDGDGLADPLWVAADGTVGFTPMASLRSDSTATPVVALGALAADENVVGSGDFDGDGFDDVLLRNEADGFTTLWLSNPGAAPDVAELGTIADSVAGVADFDADGNADILWRAPQGSLVVWLMQGAVVRDAVEVLLPGAPELLASGDFDGDGAADVAHRDPATGVVSILHPVVGALLGSTDLGDTRGWAPLGAADLDGDGTADLVFESDAALRIAYLPGEETLALDPASPWTPVPLLR